ncbi:MAG TPA: galactokinase family protein, partial [Tepidisphaeraceae bacterium]|nr:galactokinase family protein [Tepidisphaeraceae bacterium]
MLDHLQQAKESFIKRFGEGGRIHAIRSPGRVNLIGEHTDYNDGFVCPMAIEPHVLMICRAREDGQVNVHSSAYAEHDVRFSVDGEIARARSGDWSNYVRGPAAMLRSKGVPMVGMDCYITNTLPTGSGLSSSAAMEVGTMLALLTLAGNEMGAQEIASLCQRAEHEYAGMPCGIMDQSIVAGGREGHAMLLDCRDLSRRFIPLDPLELRVVVVNSNFKHQLVGSEYADRRRECEAGVAHFRKLNPGITHLRDVTLELGRGEVVALLG